MKEKIDLGNNLTGIEYTIPYGCAREFDNGNKLFVMYFGVNKGNLINKSGEPIQLHIFLHKHTKAKYTKPWTLDFNYHFFDNPQDDFFSREFKITTWGNTIHECFVGMRKQLSSIKYISKISLSH